MEAQSRKAQTKEALLTAFRDLFFERGYEAIRVGDIIARAGVGRSTFYEHYRSSTRSTHKAWSARRRA